MTSLESVSILLLIPALSAWVNHKFLKLPASIGVMAVSLIISLTIITLGRLELFDSSLAARFVSSINFEELILHGMLAFLLFAGGLNINLSDLGSQKGPIAALSTVGVLLATAITGTLFWIALNAMGMPVPFVFCLLFGAVVSPTDAVAVLGILRKAGAPKSLETKIVGESLFNDGVGVAVFFAVSALAFKGEISLASTLSLLLIEVLGGALVGTFLGWIAYRMLRSIDGYPVEIMITLALASGGYVLAERLHVSAPICVAIAGLIIGNYGRASAMSQETVEHLNIFWELVDEILNAILFVLIGLEVLVIHSGLSYILSGVVGIVIILISRFISVALPITLLRKRRPFDPHAIKILAWGGLRGGISVALALSLPHGFITPMGDIRDLVITATYVVVLFSVLVQGTTLSALFRYTATEEFRKILGAPPTTTPASSRHPPTAG